MSLTADLQLKISNRQILKIALPVSFAIFVPQINFITNNIFLGGLGEEALAIAGITGVAYLIFAVVGQGLNNGLQALISRRAGENRPDEIGNLFTHALRISLAFALISIAVIYITAPYFLQMALHSTVIQERAVSFLRIRVLGVLFLYVYQMSNALLVGTNQSKFLMFGALCETLSNIFFDYGFIYGKFGLPELGFNGAAYASLIAEFTGMAVVLGVIHLTDIHKRFKLYENLRTNFDTIRLILVQSSPLIFQYAISIVSWNIFYILIEHHGPRALAISNTMRNIFGLFGVFTWAFASTTNTMVSNVIGQGMKEEVHGLILKIIRLSMTTGIFFCLLINLLPTLFLSVFGQGEAFTVEAIPVVRVVSSALVLMSFSNIWLNAITGTGNTRVNLLIECITITGYLIYVYLVLEVFNLPIVIGWMSEWLYWTLIFLMSWLYMRSGRWKHKVV